MRPPIIPSAPGVRVESVELTQTRDVFPIRSDGRLIKVDYPGQIVGYKSGPWRTTLSVVVVTPTEPRGFAERVSEPFPMGEGVEAYLVSVLTTRDWPRWVGPGGIRRWRTLFIFELAGQVTRESAVSLETMFPLPGAERLDQATRALGVPGPTTTRLGGSQAD